MLVVKGSLSLESPNTEKKGRQKGVLKQDRAAGTLMLVWLFLNFNHN